MRSGTNEFLSLFLVHTVPASRQKQLQILWQRVARISQNSRRFLVLTLNVRNVWLYYFFFSDPYQLTKDNVRIDSTKQTKLLGVEKLCCTLWWSTIRRWRESLEETVNDSLVCKLQNIELLYLFQLALLVILPFRCCAYASIRFLC